MIEGVFEQKLRVTVVLCCVHASNIDLEAPVSEGYTGLSTNSQLFQVSSQTFSGPIESKSKSGVSLLMGTTFYLSEERIIDPTLSQFFGARVSY